MKWLTEKLALVVRHHRALVTATAAVVVDLVNGLPLLHAVARALADLLVV